MRQGKFFSRFALSVALGACIVVSAASAVRAADPMISAEPAIAPLVAMHQVDMHFVPMERYQQLSHRPGQMPFLTGMDPEMYREHLIMARHNPYAPYNPNAIPSWFESNPFTPTLGVKFAGQKDSASTCPYFGGCEPPDMGVGASSTFVVEAVNTSIAVYSTTGAIKPGFPKNTTAFFGIPAPGSCDPAGPFTSDPRVMYDVTDGRFWITYLQIEGAFGLNSCPEKTIYWAAVSKTSDPTGGWNVYAFNMAAGTTNGADYTQTGFDATTFTFGGNMFDMTGSAYKYDEIFAASKASMEAESAVVAHGLNKIKVGTTLVDTLQPVMVEGSSPAATLFVDSFNIFSGGGGCFTGCSGINVFAMANPLTAPTLTHKTIASLSYVSPPNADEPGCTACVETIDTRITGTPVYRGGSITFALETGVTVGSVTNPGIMWGQVTPTLSGSTITGGTMTQNAYLSFTGDRAASFGATMTDAAGSMLMVFDSMSSTLDPSAYYTSRHFSDPASTLGPVKTLFKGTAATFDSRWGDYEATSFDGSKVWLASQYSGSTGDWFTEVGKANTL